MHVFHACCVPYNLQLLCCNSHSFETMKRSAAATPVHNHCCLNHIFIALLPMCFAVNRLCSRGCRWIRDFHIASLHYQKYCAWDVGFESAIIHENDTRLDIFPIEFILGGVLYNQCESSSAGVGEVWLASPCSLFRVQRNGYLDVGWLEGRNPKNSLW